MRIPILLSTLLFSATTFAQSQNRKLTITHLTKDFYVYTTFGDPGDGSSFPANGMYVVTDSGAVLFDTPWDTSQFQPLIDSIKAKHNANVVLCISTHFHDDRTAGLTYYKAQGIQTYTTQQTDELSKKRNKPRAEYLIYRDTTFNVGQHYFQTFYPGKGHSPDNIVIWFEKEKVLYGGCFIKSMDTESPGNLSDADIGQWIESAKNVQRKFGKPKYIIPGHQSWTSNQSLSHTIQLLETFKKENSR